MNKLGFLVALLLIGFVAHAQQLKVVEFRADLTMPDASRYPMNDLNGDHCGLIKLGLPLPVSDVIFEGNIISAVYKEGEWWIYMPKESNWLTIKSKSSTYLPLRHEFEGIESNVTYIMMVAISTNPSGKPKPTHQYLAFQITPTTATLEVNGELWEVGTDGTATHFVGFGIYSYTVQAPNYHSERGTVKVMDPENTQIVKIDLKPDFIKVTLKVDADAEIWVNNVKKGTRTWTGSLGKGSYKIECKQDGYETSMITQEITSDMTGQTINLPQPTPLYGSLNIESTPSFAEIYLDGKKVGETPKFISEIPIGKHELKLKKEGYADYTETVSIKKNDRTQVKAKLVADAIVVEKPKQPSTTKGSSNVSGTYNGHDYVDLGLPSGTLWATCNVGAEKPEDYGDYYAWGETSPKKTYNWDTYQYCKKGNLKKLTKYCNDSKYGSNRFTDNLTVLQASDDAATANWGSGWCIPSNEQWKELKLNTTVQETTQNGVKGLLLTSKKNGQTLFLPAAGERIDSELHNAGSSCFYWSRLLHKGYPWGALYLFYGSPTFYEISYMGRYVGISVRAVREN